MSRSFGSRAAFTMIEIAISLAVIGFALVAIIGVLPLGINVQRENREETLINQEANVFINAIRNGQRGLDDLTNYVISITNNVWFVNEEYVRTNTAGYPPRVPDQTNWHTFFAANVNATPRPDLRLTNGLRVVGLMSTPKYIWTGSEFEVHQIVAQFRALSGAASEKAPQTNENIMNLSFAYKLYPQLLPVAVAETNVNLFSRTWDTNLHELRLFFRWPILPNGQVGNGHQVFRTLAAGRIEQVANGTMTNLYFLQPGTFATAFE